MKIIPVIDVLNGIAVHGIQGERKQYKPLKSLLCRSFKPTEIAYAFELLGFDSLYLADLDAIMKNTVNYNIYQQITEKTSLNLMIDAGISNIKKTKKVLETGTSKIIIGSETLNSLDFVEKCVNAFGENKIVVSVDQKGGKLLGSSQTITSLDAVSFAKKIEDLGIRQIILLELDRVGTEDGTNFNLIRNVLEKTELNVIVGGGIRNLQEIRELSSLGVSGALVATALHNRKVAVEDLKSAGFL
jgi:phosphoribosylformimino-5-aminoimidazole carboxamide ribotide isomerase